MMKKNDLIHQVLNEISLNVIDHYLQERMIGLMKDELGEKIMTEFIALRPKIYSYLTDDCKEDKKAKGTKKCVLKKDLNLLL